MPYFSNYSVHSEWTESSLCKNGRTWVKYFSLPRRQPMKFHQNRCVTLHALPLWSAERFVASGSSIFGTNVQKTLKRIGCSDLHRTKSPVHVSVQSDRKPLIITPTCNTCNNGLNLNNLPTENPLTGLAGNLSVGFYFIRTKLCPWEVRVGFINVDEIKIINKQVVLLHIFFKYIVQRYYLRIRMSEYF